MARGIGALNVSVNAHTAKAIKNLRDFGTEARSVGKDAKQMAAEFQGNTIADYMSRFGGVKQVGVDSKKTAADVRDLGGSFVDLSRDTKRYNDVLGETAPLTKRMEQSLKAIKAVGKIAIPITVAISGFNVGKAIGDELFMSEESWGDRFTKWKENLLDPRLVANREAKKKALAEAQQRAAEEKKQRDQEAAQRKADLDKSYRDELAAAERRAFVAKHGEKHAQFRDDVKKFGAGRAAELAKERQAAFEAEKALADREEKEKQIAKAKEERERKQRAAEKAARDQRKKDEETFLEMRRRVEDFGKSAIERERAEVLRTIKDPDLRALTGREFDKLAKLERNKTNREILDGRKDGSADALMDARTAEGWAELRKNMRTNVAELQLKRQEEALAEHRNANEHLRKIADNKPEVFSLN